MPALPFVDTPDGPAWSVGGAGGGYIPGAAAVNPGGSTVNADASPVGTGDLTADHNTPLHVGGLILLGLGIIIGLKYLGFRFAVDVGVGG